MAYEKLAILATKLRERTVRGDVTWEETAKKDVYQATFGGHTIQIFLIPSEMDPDEDSIKDVAIVILNDEGNEIESFTDIDLKEFPMPEIGPYRVMRETYDTARRMALGTEKAISSILSILDDVDVDVDEDEDEPPF